MARLARAARLPALLLALASAAAAQHPGPARDAAQVRPLLERLALADAAVIGRVERVETGRIHIEAAEALFGAPPTRFALKRAPSRPPPLDPGMRALLLLRGARSPYLLVDGASELPILGDATSAERWREALTALRAADDDPERQRRLHLDWLASPDAALRAAAESGLASPQAPFAPLPADVLEDLVADAVDPELASPRRRAAARVALGTGPGRAALLPLLPGDADAADAELVLDALQLGAVDPGLDGLLARCLEHPRAEVRRAALHLSRRAARGAQARLALEGVAESDPIEDHRLRARRALGRN